MGSIDIIKPMSTVLSSAVNKSQQHQDKNSLERRELNLGPLGEKQECHPFVLSPRLGNLLFAIMPEELWSGVFEQLFTEQGSWVQSQL